MFDPLIDINDLGRLLKVPTKTIRNKLSDGSWPIDPVRIGRALRWRKEDVIAWLETQNEDLPPLPAEGIDGRPRSCA